MLSLHSRDKRRQRAILKSLGKKIFNKRFAGCRISDPCNRERQRTFCRRPHVASAMYTRTLPGINKLSFVKSERIKNQYSYERFLSEVSRLSYSTKDQKLAVICFCLVMLKFLQQLRHGLIDRRLVFKQEQIIAPS